MLNRTVCIGLAVAFGLVVLVVKFSLEPVSAQEKAAPTVPKWEYKVVLLENGPDNDPRANQAEFNKLGAESWELCALHSSNRPNFCIFKRPKR
jgi:hypothetical protein